MYQGAYANEETIFYDDFSTDKSIICSKNEHVIIKENDGRNIFHLSEDFNDFIEIFNIQTQKFLTSETQITFSFEINSLLASYAYIPFQLEVNGVIFEYSRHPIGDKEHTLEIYNSQTKEIFGVYHPRYNDYDFVIILRRIGNRCCIFISRSLISEFSIDDFADLKRQIFVKWSLKKKHKIDFRRIEIGKIKLIESEYFYENIHLEHFLVTNRYDIHISEESELYYLVGNGRKLTLKQEAKRSQYKHLYIALIELTIDGGVYFCLNAKRISFFSEGMIAKITNCKNRICDNPELVGKLKAENLTTDINTIKIFSLLDCSEFQSILSTVLKIRYGIDNHIESYINADFQEFRSFNLSDLIPTFNNFDFKFFTKENYMVVGSTNINEGKHISFELEEIELNSYEFSIFFDLSSCVPINLKSLDFYMEMTFVTDALEFEYYVATSDGNIIKETIIDDRTLINVNIYRLEDSRKKTILNKSIPYLYGCNYNYKIQKIDDYYFFTFNDIYLGSALRPDYLSNSSNQFFVDFNLNENISILTIKNLTINEIVKTDFLELVDRLKDFKSEKLFYISIGRDYMEDDGNGGGRDDTYIEKIDNFEDAKNVIENKFFNIPEDSRNQLSDYLHFIVTNDYNLINRYRNAIEIEELITQTNFIQDDLFHFALVLFGFCVQCKAFESKENWYDSDSGNTYLVPDDSGWVICNSKAFHF